MGFNENLAQLAGVDHIERIRVYRERMLLSDIQNIDGKMGSLKVYANLLDFKDGQINRETAQRGLEIFDEVVEKARKKPGEHPNIDILIEVAESGSPVTATIEYKLTT